MKDSKSTMIPLEPDTQVELDKVLKAGGSGKVMIEGSDEVFIIKKQRVAMIMNCRKLLQNLLVIICAAH